MLQKRPTWQTEWAEMTEHGTPLPNEMIVLSSVGAPSGGGTIMRNAEPAPSTYCFVPVVQGKKVVRMIVVPIITGGENSTRNGAGTAVIKTGVLSKEERAARLARGTAIPDDILLNNIPDAEHNSTRSATNKSLSLGAPLILDEEGIDKNAVARSFIGLGVVKKWHDKGYELNIELTPAPPQSKTRGEWGEYYFEFKVWYRPDVWNYELISLINDSGCRIVQGFSYADFVYGVQYDKPYYWAWKAFGVRLIPTRAPVVSMELSFERYSIALRNELWREIDYSEHILELYLTHEWMASKFSSGNPSGGGSSGGGGGSGNTGSGSGGNSGGTPGSPTGVPFPNATYSRPDLPVTITPQDSGKNYCAIAIIAFLRDYFKLPKMSQDDIELDYAMFAYNKGGDPDVVAITGIHPENLIPYVEKYFTTVNGTFPYDTMVANGYFCMIDLPVGADMTHTVLIIGKQGDYLVCYDPNDGKQKVSHYSNFGKGKSSYAIIITGEKK